MSNQRDLNAYIARVRQRLQLRAGVRGAAILFGAALLLTLSLVWLLNRYAFPHDGVVKARAGLIAALAIAAVAGLVWPLVRITRRPSISESRAATTRSWSY